MENEQRIQTIADIDPLLETDEVTLENPFIADNTSMTTVSQGKLPTKTKWKKKKRKLEELTDFEAQLIDSINNVAEAIRENTKVMRSLRQHVYPESEIYSELELMGMTQDDIFNAYLFLVKRPDKTRAFFGCPLAVRMTILDRMMRSSE
uniref:uncharacterized protein LOC122585323 n=1 Tax=Erigeron canadensis TaxID=72917 RepID=UPI001CB8CF2D|nr:uncharacterized protein LOC122585323 [Erigeron canadensis]